MQKAVATRYHKLWKKAERLLEKCLNDYLKLCLAKPDATQGDTIMPDPRTLNYIVTCLKRAQEGRKALLSLGEKLNNDATTNGNYPETILSEISKIIESMQNGEDEE